MFLLRSFCTLLIINLIPLSIYSQPDIAWQATLGGSAEEIAYDVEECPDGGYIVVGSSRSDDGDVSSSFNWRDFWVVKLSDEGELIWESTYGGSNHETARDVLPTIDGGYIVAGASSSSDGQVSENQGSGDCWILKLDSIGGIEWEKSYGGSGSEFGYAIEQTNDGGYYIAGGSQSSNGDVGGNQGGVDYWVLRLSPTGDLIWENNYGGSRDDLAFSLDKTSDNGCVVAGRSRSSNGDVTGNHGGGNFIFDCWVIKLAPDGQIEWERSLGGTGNDEGYSVRQTSDGGYVVAGLTNSTDGDVIGSPLGTDLWVVKLNAQGEITWQNFYGGFSTDIAGSIRETEGGGYIVTGCTGQAGDKRFWTIKLTADGTLDWRKSYGGTEDDRSFAVQQTSDNGFIVAGRTASDNGDVSGQNGDYDFWVVKLNACGLNTDVEVMEDGLQSLEVALSSSYQWIDCSSGEAIEGEEEAFFSPALGGEYAVILSNGSCIDTSACVSFCPLPDELTLIGDTTLQVSEDASGLTIQWINCTDGMAIDGATDPSFTPSENGQYAAVIGDANCSLTTSCVSLCPQEVQVELSIANDTLFVITEGDLATLYRWYNCSTGQFLGSSSTPFILLEESGEYGVIVNEGQCASELVCSTYCNIDTEITLVNNTLLVAADSDISGFQWIDCDTESEILGATEQGFFPSVSGNYSVIVTQGSCVDTAACFSFCLVDTELIVTEEFIEAPSDSLTTGIEWINCDGNVLIEGENEVTFSPESTGFYAAIITQGSCVDTSDCVRFCVIDTTLSVVGNTVFSAADTTGTTFQWFDCETEQLFQGENGPSFTPTADGQYAVIIRQGTCSSSSECIDFTLVNSQDIHTPTTRIFPNPVEDTLTITTSYSTSIVSYKIINQHGQVMQSGKLVGEKTLRISALPAGVYFIRFEQADKVWLERFVK